MASVNGAGFKHGLVRESNVAEVNHPIRSDRHTLRQGYALKQLFQLGVLGNNRSLCLDLASGDRHEQ